MTLYFRINEYNRIVIVDINDKLQDLSSIKNKFIIEREVENTNFIYPVSFEFLEKNSFLSSKKIMKEYYFKTFGK